MKNTQDYFKGLFIFEMANNHQGDVAHGIRIIQEMGALARKYNIKAAVKLQYRQLDTFIHPDFRNDTKAKHISRFLSTELNPGQFLELVQAIKAEGMISMCTPFDEESVDLILEHEIEIIKIASCSADDWPLLERIVKTNKPIIASTGGLSLLEIDNLVTFLGHRDSNFAVLHCVGIYPSPNEVLNLNFLGKLKQRYPEIVIGYSGHESPENLDVVQVAIAKGAEIFERHVGVPTESIVLNGYSMNPQETDAWINAAHTAWNICGNVMKNVTKNESDSLLSLKRGVFARREIKKGETLTLEDVFFAMPCSEGQTNSSEFGRIRAKFVASKDYKINESVFEKSNPDQYYLIRSIIHEAKGLLSEAGVVLNDKAEIELSHHYGIEQFRKFGILIVNLINREYCKKIIVVFPGQHHPEQHHIKKEETFHVLSGRLGVSMNGIESTLEKGEILTVERGVKHAFWSENGAIIEEVSTTHYRNDSFYTDPKINELDPMQRKTILTEF
jgi:sialic acid synthase SpsE/mannose-6-phosphate isomerase-like protein (cupin superfamily)